VGKAVLNLAVLVVLERPVVLEDLPLLYLVVQLLLVDLESLVVPVVLQNLNVVQSIFLKN
jgi:hypothetical protein